MYTNIFQQSNIALTYENPYKGHHSASIQDMVGLKTGVTGTRFENKQRGKVNKVYLCDYQESLNPNNEYYMGYWRATSRCSF